MFLFWVVGDVEKMYSIQTKRLWGGHLEMCQGHKAPLVCSQLDRECACPDGKSEKKRERGEKRRLGVGRRRYRVVIIWLESRQKKNKKKGFARNTDEPGSRPSKMDERKKVRVRERVREKRHKETKREGQSSLI